MPVLIAVLFGVSILLFLLSFIKKDKSKVMEEEFEQFSMTYYQDMYQLKKRIQVLEEELMLSGEDQPLFTVGKGPKVNANPNLHLKASSHAYDNESLTPTGGVHQIIKSQVISLNQQGVPIDRIAKQSALSKEVVLSIIEEAGGSGYGS